MFSVEAVRIEGLVTGEMMPSVGGLSDGAGGSVLLRSYKYVKYQYGEWEHYFGIVVMRWGTNTQKIHSLFCVWSSQAKYTKRSVQNEGILCVCGGGRTDLSKQDNFT